jgi:hypothetical protein
MKKRTALILALSTLASGQSMTQSAAPFDDTELSKEIENPVTRRITLPLRYEADFWMAPTRRPKTRSKSIRRCCFSD